MHRKLQTAQERGFNRAVPSPPCTPASNKISCHCGTCVLLACVPAACMSACVLLACVRACCFNCMCARCFSCMRACCVCRLHMCAAHARLLSACVRACCESLALKIASDFIAVRRASKVAFLLWWFCTTFQRLSFHEFCSHSVLTQGSLTKQHHAKTVHAYSN